MAFENPPVIKMCICLVTIEVMENLNLICACFIFFSYPANNLLLGVHPFDCTLALDVSLTDCK